MDLSCVCRHIYTYFNCFCAFLTSELCLCMCRCVIDIIDAYSAETTEDLLIIQT